MPSRDTHKERTVRPGGGKKRRAKKHPEFRALGIHDESIKNGKSHVAGTGISPHRPSAVTSTAVKQKEQNA